VLKFHHDFSLNESSEHLALMDKAYEAVKEENESGQIGYYRLPKETLSIVEAVSGSELYLDSAIENIVVIGIGGSSLGIKAIMQMLPSDSVKPVYFLENSDPVNISEIFSKIKKSNTAFIVISKSGGTIETTSIFKVAIEYFNIDLDSEDSKKIVAITDGGSSLSKFADEYGIVQYNIPLNVGGRFSVLSAVGIVPLVLAGFNATAILNGAEEFMQSFFDRREDHLLRKALYYTQNSGKECMNVIFSYASNMENLSKWYVQLWGESLGKISKSGKKVGLTPIGLIGSTDQHSFLQLIMEGPRDKTVTFINVDDFQNSLSVPNITLKHIEKTDFINNHSFNELINAQCSATKESLIQSGISVDSITYDKVDEENIGATIIYYELLTSICGLMLDINTYNQPGVELGKTILEKKFK